MPTFSTIELENLLEPRVRDSYTKPPLSDRIAAPPPPPKRDESYALQGREISVSKAPPAPRHIYISPALYATPKQAPIPDTASEPSSPSPYVVNHKRRGGGVGVVGNRNGGGFEIPAEEKGGELVVVEEEAGEVMQDNFGGGAEDELFGEEEDGFLDPRCESESLGSRNEVTGQFDCRSFVSNQGEFFDAIEDFSSDTSNSNAPSYDPNLESELRSLRLSLLEEIERRKQAEEDLSLIRGQWLRIIDLLSEVGIALPSPSNSSGSMQQNNAAFEDLAQEVVVARFVAHAIGIGEAQAEAEIAAEAILESKDQEISRLRDKLQYYEAVNHEMAQRNQGIIELARQQRQRRKIRRRWFWSCIGVSIAIGISAVAYSYLPQASKHQEGSSCSDASTGSCISSFDTA
ncbi:uncharacterized protein [Coffea arabica]|uniref:Uncharacterized protein LOC113727905 n=1 Tax=Coffea arabica TaxID=13443 RepID=A0A6P6VYB2_COFAR|nr:uncharacterized protein LOC113727905 [Coffea arabica]